MTLTNPRMSSWAMTIGVLLETGAASTATAGSLISLQLRENSYKDAQDSVAQERLDPARGRCYYGTPRQPLTLYTH